MITVNNLLHQSRYLSTECLNAFLFLIHNEKKNCTILSLKQHLNSLSPELIFQFGQNFGKEAVCDKIITSLDAIYWYQIEGN